MENDYLADSSDDEENYVAQDADCFLDPFADNNEERGWMLDGGSSVRNMLISKTYEALEINEEVQKKRFVRSQCHPVFFFFFFFSFCSAVLRCQCIYMYAGSDFRQLLTYPLN